MSKMSTTAERFRLVKDAYHDFITRWALDMALRQAFVTDRIHGEVMSFEESGYLGRSGLYRPGELDD